MNATPPELGVGESLKSYALYEFDVAGRMLGRGPAELHAGIHEARKSIRHIRVTLRLARKALGDDADMALAELGALTEGLSDIRDADVAVETIESLVAKTRSRAQRASLRRVCRWFAAQRSAALGRLLDDDPTLLHRRAELRRLRDTVAELPWSTVTARTVQAALARTTGRARRVGKRAHASRKGRLRHRWRRRLRRLRQQLTIVESELGWLLSTRGSWSWPDPTARDATAVVVVELRPKALRTITDRLGFEHDLRTLRVALRAADGLGNDDRRQALRIVRAAIRAVLAEV